jgi:uncharacterized membrane protein
VSPAPERIVLRPNCSLSRRGRLVLFAAIAAGAAAIAAVLVATGAWPVALFLVLEVAVVAVVLCLLQRHADDCEVLVLDDAHLELTQRRGGRETRHRFQRYWARVALEPVRGGYHPSRLTIRSHGRAVELGRQLNEDARRALARALRGQLGPAPAPQRFSIIHPSEET